MLRDARELDDDDAPELCAPGAEDVRTFRGFARLAVLRAAELVAPPLTDDTDRAALTPLLAVVRAPIVPVRLSLSPVSPLLCLPEPPPSPSSRILGVTTTRPLDPPEWPSEFDVPSPTLGATRVDVVGTGAGVVVVLVAGVVSKEFAVVPSTPAGRVVITVGIWDARGA